MNKKLKLADFTPTHKGGGTEYIVFHNLNIAKWNRIYCFP